MEKQFELTATDGSKIYVSEEAIKFITELNDEGIKKLNNTINFIQTVHATGKVFRWIIMGLLAVTSAVVSISAGVKSFFNHG